MDRIRIRFLTAHDRYNAREVAGFEPAIAKRLVEAGIAEVWDDAAAEADIAAETAMADALTRRENELAAREAEVAAREAALEADKGAPPSQGSGKAAKTSPAAD